MNDFNNLDNKENISEKLKEVFIKIFNKIFDFKNIMRVFELVLLLIFSVFYGKKPLVDWQ
jgi:hypothetical protein